ncbi:MAG TPA: amidohydrolase family protein, partial [Kofleriaceae bacterium]
IELPLELARVLRDHEARWTDAAGLAPLYTSDAMVRTSDRRGWVRGRAAAAAFEGQLFGREYRMTPVVSRIDGNRAHIGGYLTRGEPADPRHFGYFDLDLLRDAGGTWQISSEIPTFPGPKYEDTEDAAQLVALLDEAGIRRAVVLSNAYWFDSHRNPSEGDPLPDVRAENDWTADQVARFPDRLVALCSFNPLAPYALAELERCATSGRFKGVKLHFGESGVDLLNRAHVESVRRVVEAANRRRLALLVHVRADGSYGAAHARVLLDLVAAAPDVPFQIAHLWGGEKFSDAALGVYADAVSAHDPRTRNLYFDLAEAALVLGHVQAELAAAVARMRQIGLDRLLYGSDGPTSESETPLVSWNRTRENLPLRADELRAIANNVAPYLGSGSPPPARVRP